MKSKPQNPKTWVCMALLSEAQFLINTFGLVQYETKPYKIFRNQSCTFHLIITGIGALSVEQSLQWLVNHEQPKGCILLGTAACQNVSIPIGTAFYSRPIHISGLEPLPVIYDHQDQVLEGFSFKLPKAWLLSVHTPLNRWDLIEEQYQPVNTTEPVLVDMEGQGFVDFCYASHIPHGVIKLVSDYGSDQIPSKQETLALMENQSDLWIDQLLFLTDRFLEESYTISKLTENFRLTFQQRKKLLDWSIDLHAWEEPSLSTLVRRISVNDRKIFMDQIEHHYGTIQRSLKDYSTFSGLTLYSKPGTIFDYGITESNGISKKIPKGLVPRLKGPLGLGDCPVASDRTRCCNLQTLDVLEGCGFECSYCAIKTFYEPSAIGFDPDFEKKLSQLTLDPGKIYHIGTGQSSDSLLWAEKQGSLKPLIEFAKQNPNVILELKTKSSRIEPLLDLSPPANVICTWSINSPMIIEKEEHHTATLDERLRAAQIVSEHGMFVGFHFHPLVYYQGWKEDYGWTVDQIIKDFKPNQVMMVSLGTLTFTKPVIKRLRKSLVRSKILQMPLVESGGKLSYPLTIKKELFSWVYTKFSPWHSHQDSHTAIEERVFFYLCMEDPHLWEPIFGYEYESNDNLENQMKNQYYKTIQTKMMDQHK
jgi:spore photoproduct lyase